METAADQMKPRPSPGQAQLWETIEPLITTERIDREVRFWELPADVKSYLASQGLSGALMQLAKKYQLDRRQAQGVARIIKLLATGEARPQNAAALLHGFGIDVGRAQSLWEEIENKALAPISGHLSQGSAASPFSQHAGLHKNAGEGATSEAEPPQTGSGNVVNLRENND